jgi:cytochrome c biogenesis protein
VIHHAIEYKFNRKAEKEMQQKKGFLDLLYQALSSMRLTVFLFLTLALCSIAGTLLPQGTSVEELERHYGPSLSWWIGSIGLNDLYRTGWFRAILLLLCVNLIICTLQRLPKTLKLLQHRDEQISPEKLEKFNCHTEITILRPLDASRTQLTEVISEEFAPLRPLANSDVFRAIAEKGRWSRLMVYAIHLSVLVILLGALLGSVLGFKGFMNLAEGETSDEVMLARGKDAIALPFQIRCDDFDVSFYDTGAPKEYRSDLTIIDKGQEVLKQSIRVNDPLSYQGVTFYQASYGSIMKRAEIELQDRDTGITHRMTLAYREVVPIPGTKDEIEVMQYQENFSNFGQAAAVVLLREGQEPTGSWILVDKPDFHGNRIQNYRVRVTHVERGYYTGLQVKQDPGVWFVYIGFMVMLTGIGMTFYTSHRKLWVWASPSKGKSDATTVFIAGRTNKNSLAFEQEFNHLCARLQNDLKPK